MDLDLNDFVLDEEENEAEEAEEQEEPEIAEEAKTEEPKDTTDRSVPLLQRLPEELQSLKLAAGFMGDYEMASASYLAGILQDVLKTEEGEYLAQKWDENKWTFPALWKAVQDEARRQSGGKSFGCKDSVVLGWVNHIVIDTKNEPKKEPKPAPKKAESAKPSKQPKPEPKKDHEQLTLDFDL